MDNLINAIQITEWLLERKYNPWFLSFFFSSCTFFFFIEVHTVKCTSLKCKIPFIFYFFTCVLHVIIMQQIQKMSELKFSSLRLPPGGNSAPIFCHHWFVLPILDLHIHEIILCTEFYLRPLHQVQICHSFISWAFSKMAETQGLSDHGHGQCA